LISAAKCAPGAANVSGIAKTFSRPIKLASQYNDTDKLRNMFFG
jgi:hypothetical protein